MMPSDPRNFIRQQPTFIKMRQAQVTHEARKNAHLQQSGQPHDSRSVESGQLAQRATLALSEEANNKSRGLTMFT